jgi:hypothetical protein
MISGKDVIDAQTTLPVLIERASRTLMEARSSAEVLEARDMARLAYDAAKSAGRIARAKQAHDEILAAVHRAQADALLVEARAKMRLADEYDAAQERGEVQVHGGRKSKVGDLNLAPSAAEIGLRRDEIHEARRLRDAEKSSPGKAERALSEIVARGEEPTKARLRQHMMGERSQASPSIADPKRRRLSSLAPDVLIDEAMALRADLAAAEAKTARLAAERDALKALISDLNSADSASVIVELRARLEDARNALQQARSEKAAALKQVRALKAELNAIRGI